MAIIPWWRERLRARKPIGAPALWIEGVTFRPHPVGNDPWPRFVSKQALYKDYQSWFDDVYLVPYRGVGLYVDNPHLMPEPASSHEFFVTMSPYINLIQGHDRTRTFKVPTKVLYHDDFITLKKRHNFLQLCDWEAHVAQFGLLTEHSFDGRGLAAAEADEWDAVVVGRAVLKEERAIEENRSRLPGKMKGVDGVEEA